MNPTSRRVCGDRDDCWSDAELLCRFYRKATPMSLRRLQRREFLEITGAALCAPYFVPSRVLGSADRPGANDRPVVAMIGVGGMGSGHLQRLLKFQERGQAARGGRV